MGIIQNCPKLYKFHFKDRIMFHYRYTIDYLNHSPFYRILNWILFHLFTIICAHNAILLALYYTPTSNSSKWLFQQTQVENSSLLLFPLSFAHYLVKTIVFIYIFHYLVIFCICFNISSVSFKKHLIGIRNKKSHGPCLPRIFGLVANAFYLYICQLKCVCYCFGWILDKNKGINIVIIYKIFPSHFLVCFLFFSFKIYT